MCVCNKNLEILKRAQQYLSILANQQRNEKMFDWEIRITE